MIFLSKLMKTLREMITEYQDEVASKNELYPERAAKILTELSALIGNIGDRIRETEIAYNKKLLECYDQEEKANRAKIVAETSKEYEDKLIAKNVERVAMELIRSLKYYLRSKSEEIREGNMQ